MTVEAKVQAVAKKQDENEYMPRARRCTAWCGEHGLRAGEGQRASEQPHLQLLRVGDHVRPPDVGPRRGVKRIDIDVGNCERTVRHRLTSVDARGAPGLTHDSSLCTFSSVDINAINCGVYELCRVTGAIITII